MRVKPGRLSRHQLDEIDSGDYGQLGVALRKGIKSFSEFVELAQIDLADPG